MGSLLLSYFLACTIERALFCRLLSAIVDGIELRSSPVKTVDWRLTVFKRDPRIEPLAFVIAISNSELCPS